MVVRMLEGKRIIVTGGTSGIGKSICTLAAHAGADVAFCGLTADGAAEVEAIVTAAGGRSFFKALDIGDLDAARQFTREAIAFLGGLDGLVNNAGTNFMYGVTDVTQAQIDRCFHVNFYSAWAVAQTAYEALKASAHGVVVNMSSIHTVQTTPGAFPYNASKAALSALTKSMAIDWAKDGILSVAVAPGWVLTPLNEKMFEEADNPHAERDRIEEGHMLGHMARPESIASFVVYLLSDGNGAINGNTIVLDGAQHTLAHPH